MQAGGLAPWAPALSWAAAAGGGPHAARTEACCSQCRPPLLSPQCSVGAGCHHEASPPGQGISSHELELGVSQADEFIACI